MSSKQKIQAKRKAKRQRQEAAKKAAERRTAPPFVPHGFGLDAAPQPPHQQPEAPPPVHEPTPRMVDNVCDPLRVSQVVENTIPSHRPSTVVANPQPTTRQVPPVNNG